MRALRNIGVGTRLGVAFGIVLAFLLVISGVSVTTTRSMQQAQAEILRHTDLRRNVSELRFHAAAFNGWQDAYALEAIQGKQGAAETSNASRADFEQDIADFRGHLGDIDAAQLTEAERADLSRIQAPLTRSWPPTPR